MPWIITRLCIDCIDTGCVSVCPVDCIYEYVGTTSEHFPNMLYIYPDECIDCGACEPECPWQAIFEEPAVPDVFKDDTDAQSQDRRDGRPVFKVKTFEPRRNIRRPNRLPKTRRNGDWTRGRSLNGPGLRSHLTFSSDRAGVARHGNAGLFVPIPGDVRGGRGAL